MCRFASVECQCTFYDTIWHQDHSVEREKINKQINKWKRKNNQRTNKRQIKCPFLLPFIKKFLRDSHQVNQYESNTRLNSLKKSKSSKQQETQILPQKCLKSTMKDEMNYTAAYGTLLITSIWFLPYTALCFSHLCTEFNSLLHDNLL